MTTREHHFEFNPELWGGLADLLDDDGKRKLHIQWCRQLHRELSQQIVECNGELVRFAAAENADESVKPQLLRIRVAHMQSRQAALEVWLENALNDPLQDYEWLNDSTSVQTGGEGRRNEKGLNQRRHLNQDFFLADLFDYTLRDDGASMEAPIFTLATKPDISVWEWKSRDGNKSVKVTPSVLGRATQFDKDVLIYVVSQLTAALNLKREDAQSRTVRFTVHDYLVATNRGVSGDDYKRLQEAFERLRGTSITTDIRTGGERVKEGFGIIDSWRIVEKSNLDGRMAAVEITLSRWLYNAVQAFEVLTIHPDYFRLRKPLARRLYELARKHCGHQASWTIGLDLLRDKSGSKSNIKEFRRMVRAIEEDGGLPEYRILVGSDDRVRFYVKDSERLVRALGRRAAGG